MILKLLILIDGWSGQSHEQREGEISEWKKTVLIHALPKTDHWVVMIESTLQRSVLVCLYFTTHPSLLPFMTPVMAV